MTAPATLEQIRSDAEGQSFPCDLLVGLESALILFAAGFHGRQDGYWIAYAGLRATCVDVDAAKLAEMETVYPEGWEFTVADVFEYAHENERRWDILSLDCPTNLFDRCARNVDLWCRLARVAVVLGTGSKSNVMAPRGWELTDMRFRSDFRGGVYWAVLERAITTTVYGPDADPLTEIRNAAEAEFA